LFTQLPYDLETIFQSSKINLMLQRVLLILLSPYWGEAHAYTLPAAYETLVQTQQALHAESLFLGCFPTDWIRLQEAHLKLNHLPRKHGQAALGIKHLITLLLETVHTVWLKRNGAIHGDDTTTKLLSYKHTQLLLDIQDLYDQVPHMLASDRDLFTKPYDYWLTQNTSQLLTFLKCMQLTVKTSVIQAADLGPNFRTIKSYFPRHPTRRL
jgi:hypothetical protein